MLIVLAGLPGVGKTTIAAALARRLDAVHVRIDAIEHEIHQSMSDPSAPINDRGYVLGRATAMTHLAAGRVVIADSVNPWPATRDAWVAVAAQAGVPALEVEIVCSNHTEHRRRIETRAADIPGFTLPTWQDVIDRDYRPWHRERTVVDTSRMSVDQCVAGIEGALVRPDES